MPDSGLIFPPGLRITTDDGTIAAGGSAEFSVTGTSTPQTVYADPDLSVSLGSVVYLDSGGHPVTAQGGSTKTAVYTGATSIKVVLKTSAGVTIATYDDIQFAQDTSGFSTLSGGGGGITGVVSKTSDYTILTTDDGTLFDCDPSGATFSMTLPSAATAGDGYTIGLRHAGTTTTNQVKWKTVSSQTVALDNTSVTADALTGGGETIWFVSNGASWDTYGRVGPRLAHPQPVPVADRVSAVPSSPTPGAFYLVTTTPTGWPSGTAEHDLMRSDGQGSWIRYRPFTDCGWLVYVQDENVYYSFQGSAWASLSNATAPGTSVLKHAVFEHIETAGTNGGGSSATAWTDRTLNTDTVNTITGCTRSTNEITLPAGTYLVIFWSMIYLAGAGLKAWTRLKSTTTSQEVMSFTEVSDASGAPIRCFGHGIITLATQEIMAFDYYANTAQASSGLGLAANLGSESERFARVEIIDLTSIQGPTGATGPQGTVVNNSYTVAALPSGTAGQVAYASNGRKNGEGGGSGTGVLVFHDGTAWRACDTGATVAA